MAKVVATYLASILSQLAITWPIMPPAAEATAN